MASRCPLLQWAREIPIGGEPADVAARFAANLANLVDSDVQKLLLHAEPGMLVGPDVVDWCRASLSRLTVVDVGGPAGHFLPEDRPTEVAEAVVGWVESLDPPDDRALDRPGAFTGTSDGVHGSVMSLGDDGRYIVTAPTHPHGHPVQSRPTKTRNA